MTYTACHRPNCRNCPTVALHPNGLDVVIKDDYKGKVRMSKSQWELMRMKGVADL